MCGRSDVGTGVGLLEQHLVFEVWHPDRAAILSSFFLVFFYILLPHITGSVPADKGRRFFKVTHLIMHHPSG